MSEKPLYEVVGDFWGPCVTEVNGQPFSTVGFITIGTEIEFDGVPGDNLKPVNAAAKAAKATELARRERLKAEAATGKKAIDDDMLAIIGQVAAAAAAEAVKAALADLTEPKAAKRA